jgi:hypothetical protein
VFTDIKNGIALPTPAVDQECSTPDIAQEMLRVQALSGEGLTNEFNAVVQREDLSLFSSFNMFAAKALEMIGFDGASNYFKKQVVTENLSSAFNQSACEAPQAADQRFLPPATAPVSVPGPTGP